MKIEVIVFETEDVITTAPHGNHDAGGTRQLTSAL